MLDKRAINKLRRDLDKLTVKVGKKRDELRDLYSDINELMQAVDDGDEGLAEVVTHLGYAKQALDRHVVDKLSEYA